MYSKSVFTDIYIYINCLVTDMYSATYISKTGRINTTWLKIKVSTGIMKVILIPFYRGWKHFWCLGKFNFLIHLSLFHQIYWKSISLKTIFTTYIDLLINFLSNFFQLHFQVFLPLTHHMLLCLLFRQKVSGNNKQLFCDPQRAKKWNKNSSLGQSLHFI